MLRDFAGGVIPVGPGDFHRANLFVLQIAQAQSSGTRQEQIEHRPAHTQASLFVQESGRSLSSGAHFLQRTLQQI